MNLSSVYGSLGIILIIVCSGALEGDMFLAACTCMFWAIIMFALAMNEEGELRYWKKIMKKRIERFRMWLRWH